MDTDMVIFVVKIDSRTELDDVRDTVKSYLETTRELNGTIASWKSGTAIPGTTLLRMMPSMTPSPIRPF